MKFEEHEQVAKEYKLGGNYWRPEKGKNKIRLLSEFEVYGEHWIQGEKKSYACIGKDDCPRCKDGVKVSPRFLVWVLDRADGEVKLGQLGYSIIKQIGNLSKSDDWGYDGFPNYDIEIEKSGSGLDTEYFVTPTPNKDELDGATNAKMKGEMKDLKGIIGKMKEKAGGSPDVIQVNDDAPPPSEEIKVDDIPF